MSKIRDYIDQNVNSQFDGELIYLKIEGNDNVGYISKLSCFNNGSLILKTINSNRHIEEISHSGHSKLEYTFYNKRLMFEIEDKLESFIQRKEIQSLILELSHEKTICSIQIDGLEYYITKIQNGNHFTYDFVENNSK